MLAVFIEEDDTGPATVPDVYLRLHLLSHRRVKPNGIALNGIIRILPNVAWTQEGPVSIDEMPLKQLSWRAQGRHPLIVHSVDKFPRMTDYVIPSGVRIADASRVRLGAYLGVGTTVMHEGFVNFNAGTDDADPDNDLKGCMVEGRISMGVFVGAGSDLGGGSSTAGTLSGGGKEVISIGRRCLIGANAGTGISLGDNCIIEAGLYITPGTKVMVIGDADTKPVKALELSGKSGLLFIRNSTTGQVEARANTKAVVLNDVLHTRQ